MKPKKGINLAAATVPRKWGSELAADLGFSRSEWLSLWSLAFFPERTLQESDDSRRTTLLKLISSKPENAGKLIQAIRDHEQERRDDVIRSVILAHVNPPNWTLQDKEIAQKVCEREGRPDLDAKSDEWRKLVARVKKQRQDIAKKFPEAKGKF